MLANIISQGRRVWVTWQTAAAGAEEDAAAQPAVVCCCKQG